jgi:hypothetical protein
MDCSSMMTPLDLSYGRRRGVKAGRQRLGRAFVPAWEAGPGRRIIGQAALPVSVEPACHPGMAPGAQIGAMSAALVAGSPHDPSMIQPPQEHAEKA